MALRATAPLEFRPTTALQKSWRYWWQPDFYDWLTDRPSPDTRRTWRFHGKAVTDWYHKAFLSPEGTGCLTEFKQVVKCIEGTSIKDAVKQKMGRMSTSQPFLPSSSDCAPELEMYFSCMEASKKFTAHFKKDVVPQYKRYLEEFNIPDVKRCSWKQTRNLMRLWYATGKPGSRQQHFMPDDWGSYPYFPDKGFSPEGWDPRMKRELHSSLRKEAYFPHTQHTWGHHPGIDDYQKYHRKIPQFSAHAGNPGGYVAPPI